MADDKIEIEITLDDGSIKKGFASIKKEAKDAGEGIDVVFGKSFGNIAVAAAKIGAAASAAALAIAAVITKKSIDAASEYESTINQLAFTLANTGRLTEGALQSFIEFSGALQKSTKFSDDQVLASANLIQTIARLDKEGLQRATKSALDLSVALGIDLDSASQLVGKALNGNVAALSRYGIKIKAGTDETQTFSNVLSSLEKRFGGASEAAANSFSGASAKLKNAFDDIFKEIGRGITRSPALISFINSITNVFSSIATSIGQSIGSTDIFKDLIINFSVIAQAGTETARRIGLSFELAALRAEQAWAAFKVLTTAGLSEGINAQLADVNKRIDETKEKFTQDSEITNFFTNLINNIQQTNGKLIEFGQGVQNNVIAPIAQASIAFSDIQKAIVDGFTTAVDYTGLALTDLAGRSARAKEQMIKDFQATGQAARNALGGAVASGFAAFGKALVTGENALEAFTKAMIGAIGQAAISEGTALILRGIAYSFDPFLAGFAPGLISAGAALATFGGALTALGGGGASSAGGGGNSGISSVSTGATSENNEQALASVEEKTTKVQIDVGGTVLDPVGVGRQIAQILNDTFEATGTRVVTS